MLPHGRRGLFSAQGLVHRYRDGDRRERLSIQAGRVFGLCPLLGLRLSAIESKQQGDQERHRGQKEKNQAHPEHGELHSNIEYFHNIPPFSRVVWKLLSIPASNRVSLAGSA
jgi:hypothetical protein